MYHLLIVDDDKINLSAPLLGKIFLECRPELEEFYNSFGRDENSTEVPG